MARVETGRMGRRSAVSSRSLQNLALHEFKPIAEGVEDVDAAETAEGSIRPGGEPGAFARRENFVESVDDKRRMRALGRVEVRLNAKMKIYGADGEPDAVASGHSGRLCDFGEAENAIIELAG